MRPVQTFFGIENSTLNPKLALTPFDKAHTIVKQLGDPLKVPTDSFEVCVRASAAECANNLSTVGLEFAYSFVGSLEGWFGLVSRFILWIPGVISSVWFTAAIRILIKLL